MIELWDSRQRRGNLKLKEAYDTISSNCQLKGALYASVSAFTYRIHLALLGELAGISIEWRGILSVSSPKGEEAEETKLQSHKRAIMYPFARETVIALITERPFS